MALTREFILFSDCVMANPNGDMINDNRPRQDERTLKLEMSDVRIKRYVRDEWENRKQKVFVRPVKNEKGEFIDCKGVADKVIRDENITERDLEAKLKSDYKDVKLFGAVITKPKFNIIGPLQIMWSRSVNEAEIKFAQGTSVFTSKSEAKQGTIWSKYFTPYALFKTYMVYNNFVAERQDIKVTEQDIEDFKDVLIAGIKNYKSTSKNQMPRLLVEVMYNKNYIDGELDVVKVHKANENVSDLEIRDIEEYEFDLSLLKDYYDSKGDVIKAINVYRHPKVRMVNGFKEISYYNI